jgi:hypothetical protein
VYVDGEHKAELLELYELKCAICGGPSSEFEWDHVARHSESFEREPEFQPLCPQCHREKPAAESRSLDTDILEQFRSSRMGAIRAITPAAAAGALGKGSPEEPSRL